MGLWGLSPFAEDEVSRAHVGRRGAIAASEPEHDEALNMQTQIQAAGLAHLRRHARQEHRSGSKTRSRALRIVHTDSSQKRSNKETNHDDQNVCVRYLVGGRCTDRERALRCTPERIL